MLSVKEQIIAHKTAATVIAAVFLLSVTAIIFTLKQPESAPSNPTTSTASSRVNVTVNEIHRLQEKSSSSSSAANTQAVLLSSSDSVQKSYSPKASSPFDHKGGPSSSGPAKNNKASVNQEKSIKAPAEVTLSVGETTGINISILPEDAVDNTVEWSSDNPKIAAVDKTGIVTGINVGSCRITVCSHHDNKVQAVIRLTVKSE